MTAQPLKKILILGAYGNFGTRITERLVQEKDLRVIIAGRSDEKCKALAVSHQKAPSVPLYHALDIEKDLPAVLGKLQPDVVIHTAGPFQGQSYHVAEACIAAGCHYIDLADGRYFVDSIGALDAAARKKGVTVISGASSVPCLTAAIVDHYLPQFTKLTSLDYAITTAQPSNIGIATTAGALSCAGKPIKTLIRGRQRIVYGWQSMHTRLYPVLGHRLLANCDIPDLAIFPQRYPALYTQRFYAGLEFATMQSGLWLLSWLARLRLVPNLSKYAGQLLKMSRHWDRYSTEQSALHMTLKGTDAEGKRSTKTFYIIAQGGHGPYIPCVPAILCAQILARGEFTKRGAFPCVDIISLEQYLDALKGLKISTTEASR